MLRGILLCLLAASGCGTSRAVSLDGAPNKPAPRDARLRRDAPLPWDTWTPQDGPVPWDAPPPCAPGRITCYWGAWCIDTNTDNQHCGACGNACDTAKGYTCVAGKCTCHCGSLTCCGHDCVDTRSDNANCGDCGIKCTGNMTCQWGVCWCPPTLPTKCSGTCVNTKSDHENCGACGVVCPDVQTCVGGQCT